MSALTRENLESNNNFIDDDVSDIESLGSEESPHIVKSSSSSKAASKIIKSRREQMRVAGSVSQEDEDCLEHLASEDTDVVKHVKSNRDAPPLPPSLSSEKIAGGSAPTYQPSRRFRANRNRIPGGAAAKLIGRNIEMEGEDVLDDGDEALEVMPPSDELDRIRMEAKNEFAKGPSANRRYYANDNDQHVVEKGPEEASLPSIINRSEVFHESAQQAVLSLLTPPRPPLRNDLSIRSSRSGLDEFTQSPVKVQLPQVSAFQAPPRRDDASSVFSSGTMTSAVVDFEHVNTGKNVLEQPLLSKKAEHWVGEISKQMKNPSKQLADLMTAIAAPADGNFTRGYMVRRKNACGALQVLTAKAVHRVQICWTLGLLPTLTSVLEDVGDDDLEEVFPDIDTRCEYIEARKRTIAALMNLSMAQDNRLAVFHSPRLVATIVQVISNDSDGSRKGCCAVLAHLSKTKENRILMAQVPGLIEVVTDVIKPKIEAKESKPEPEEDEDDDNDSTSTVSQDDTRLFAVSGSDGSEGAPESFFDSFEEEKIKSREAEEKKSRTQVKTSPSDPKRDSEIYDNDPNVHLHGARQNIFALLSHLVKEKDNAVRI